MKLIDQNGQNFEYVLEYSSNDPDFSAKETFNATEKEFKIPNAGYYRLWSYKIYGKNRVGPGPNCSGAANSGQDGKLCRLLGSGRECHHKIVLFSIISEFVISSVVVLENVCSLFWVSNVDRCI